MSKRLRPNAIAVRGAKCDPSKRVVYSVDGVAGLRLYVEPTSRRSWYYEYKVAGRRNRMRIGDAAVVSLADARIQAMNLRRDVELGDDPKLREIEQKQVCQREQFTFRRLFDRWLKAHGHLRGLKERVRALEADALPALQDMPVNEITKRDVIDIIDRIADRGARIHADHITAYLSAIFNWGIDEELCESNPAHRIRKRGVARPRERVLSDDELVGIWRVLDEPETSKVVVADITSAALKFALLTGQRRGEIVAARRSDVDVSTSTWTIPGERTKNARTHVLPLGPMALSIVSERLENDPGEFIFPAATTIAETRHLHPRSASKALEKICRALEIEGVSMHCFRRTVATRMGDLGVTGDVISRILNHTPQDVTRRHYNHARMLAQMREALEIWEAQIMERDGVVSTE